MGILTGLIIFLSGAICGVVGLVVGIIYLLNVQTGKLEKISKFPDLAPKNIPKQIPVMAKPINIPHHLVRTSDLSEIQQRKLICEILEANGILTLETSGT
jgi:hypothetical protein